MLKYRELKKDLKKVFEPERTSLDNFGLGGIYVGCTKVGCRGGIEQLGNILLAAQTLTDQTVYLAANIFMSLDDQNITKNER